ncbi:hypothetical protein GcM3_005044, partial [Golovinomyces cichoracearum]
VYYSLIPNSTLQIRLGEPLLDAEYDNPEDVLQAYQDHGKLNGYGLCDIGDKYCDRKNPNLHESKRCFFKKNGETRTRKTGCSIFEGKEFQNHESSDGPVNDSANRTKALNENPEARRYLVSQLSRNSSVSTIRAELLNIWQIEVTQRVIYNISKTALQWVVEFLGKCPFFFRLDTDGNNRFTHLYLSPEENVKIWKENPDILLADTTYNINRFNQPMINICDSAENRMTPQLAVSFFSGEKEEDYKLVLNCT